MSRVDRRTWATVIVIIASVAPHAWLFYYWRSVVALTLPSLLTALPLYAAATARRGARWKVAVLGGLSALLWIAGCWLSLLFALFGAFMLLMTVVLCFVVPPAGWTQPLPRAADISSVPNEESERWTRSNPS
jgi:hypothetical protein